MTDYDLGIFPPNDNLYCPDCGGAKTRTGQEWHTWKCTRKEMTTNTDSEWMKTKAEQEDGCVVSVGGMVSDE